MAPDAVPRRDRVARADVNPRISFRLAPDIKAAAVQVAAENGLTLSGMVREFLYRYILTEPEPIRTLPNTRGAPTVTLYVGSKLARAARLHAERPDRSAEPTSDLQSLMRTS